MPDRYTKKIPWLYLLAKGFKTVCKSGTIQVGRGRFGGKVKYGVTGMGLPE